MNDQPPRDDLLKRYPVHTANTRHARAARAMAARLGSVFRSLGERARPGGPPWEFNESLHAALLMRFFCQTRSSVGTYFVSGPRTRLVVLAQFRASRFQSAEIFRLGEPLGSFVYRHADGREGFFK